MMGDSNETLRIDACADSNVTSIQPHWPRRSLCSTLPVCFLFLAQFHSSSFMPLLCSFHFRVVLTQVDCSLLFVCLLFLCSSCPGFFSQLVPSFPSDKRLLSLFCVLKPLHLLASIHHPFHSLFLINNISLSLIQPLLFHRNSLKHGSFLACLPRCSACGYTDFKNDNFRRGIFEQASIGNDKLDYTVSLC